MTIMEILLLVCGLAIFVVSFLIKGNNENGGSVAEFNREDVQQYIDQSIESAKSRLEDMTNESVQYAFERTEASLDRIANEKMMAVNEYSDTVLGEIDKNHQEVLFLYDMLNEKSVDLKNTVRQAQALEKDIKVTNETLAVNAEKIESAAAAVANAEPAQEKSFTVLGADAFAKFDSNGNMTKEGSIRPANEGEQENRVLSAIERLSSMPKTNEVNESTAESKPKRGRKKKETASVTPVNLNEVNQGGSMEVDISSITTRNKNERILNLHHAGKSNVEIARELGLGMGEVKLVIDLFEGQK